MWSSAHWIARKLPCWTYSTRSFPFATTLSADSGSRARMRSSSFISSMGLPTQRNAIATIVLDQLDQLDQLGLSDQRKGDRIAASGPKADRWLLVVGSFMRVSRLDRDL